MPYIYGARASWHRILSFSESSVVFTKEEKLSPFFSPAIVFSFRPLQFIERKPGFIAQVYLLSRNMIQYLLLALYRVRVVRDRVSSTMKRVGKWKERFGTRYCLSVSGPWALLKGDSIAGFSEDPVSINIGKSLWKRVFNFFVFFISDREAYTTISMDTAVRTTSCPIQNEYIL